MSTIIAKKPAPVVSSDSTSPEAQLALKSATLNHQSSSDSLYDTVIERFSASIDTYSAINHQTIGLSIIAGILTGIFLYIIPRKRK
jgi:hypothetical protein